MLRPPPLRPGDAVALVSPSGPVPAERVEAAVSVLTGWGLEPEVYPHVLERHGYFGGTDQQRLADLTDALTNPRMRAIWCTRGGYGIQRIVDSLDLGVLSDDPKLIIGFSDITALHLAAWRRAQLATVHGPVAAQLDKGADSIIARGARHALMTAEQVVIEADPAELTHAVRVPGRVEGRVLGCNLSLLCATAGTPDMPDFFDAILLIEEVNEAPYRVDRMLTHLLRTGVLADVSGVAIGQFTECGEVAGVIAERLESLGVPVLGGLPIGHGEQQLAVPLGTPAVMDADAGTLVVTSATRSS